MQSEVRGCFTWTDTCRLRAVGGTQDYSVGCVHGSSPGVSGLSPESVTTARVPSQGPSVASGLDAGVGQLAVTLAPWFPKQCLV